MSGLLIPGSLNVSLKETLGVGIYSIEQNLLYNVEMYDVASVPRTKADGSVNFDYYIETEYNLNSKISYESSSSEYNKDDAYGLESITITHENSINTNYLLPSASNILVNAGEIDAQELNYNSLGKFPVTLTISCNDQGVMVSNISISGEDVTAEIIDNPNQAQKVYWPIKDSKPNIAADDGDILTSKITSSELTTIYSSELDLINDNYNNKQMIKTWTININKIELSSNNILSKHVRYIGKAGTTQIFDEDQKLVAATPFSYGVTISDYLNNDITIIPHSNVYGVISNKS